MKQLKYKVTLFVLLGIFGFFIAFLLSSQNTYAQETTEKELILGDVNATSTVSSADAIWLLRHTLFPSRYQINQPADFNNDGIEDSADAIWLLRHTLFPAKFSLHTSVYYSITWKNYDGTILATNNVALGSLPSFNGNAPSRENSAHVTYTFTGWEPAVSAASRDIEYVADYLEVIEQYSVVWKNYDGSVLKSDRFDYGSIPTYSGSAPIRERDTKDYSFSEWSPSIEMVQKDTVYVAQYTPSAISSYTIKYNANGGANPPLDQIKQKGKQISLSTDRPTRVGASFVYWYCGNDGKTYFPGDTFTLDEDVEFYAIWSFVCSKCGGTGGYYTQVSCTHCNGKGYFSTKRTWTCPTCNGKGRLPDYSPCWECHGVGEITSTTWEVSDCEWCSGTGKTNKRVYCTNCVGGYIPIETSPKAVKLMCDESLFGSTEVYLKRPFVLSVPSKDNNTFLGWFDSPIGGNQYTDSRGKSLSTWKEANEQTLYAHWSPLIFTIKYVCDDIPTDSFPLVYSTDTESIELPFIESGAYSVHWFVDGKETNKIDTSLGGNLTCQGIWQPISYSISYDLQGGSGEYKTSYTIEDKPITFSIPTKTGYTFLGWTGSNGIVPQKELVISNDTYGDLYYVANWQINQYTISFNTDGGSMVESITKDYDSILVQPNNPVKEGKSFDGWYDLRTESEFSFDRMPAQNIELYAKWIEYGVTISYTERPVIVDSEALIPATYSAKAVDTDGNELEVFLTVEEGHLIPGETVIVKLFAEGLYGVRDEVIAESLVQKRELTKIDICTMPLKTDYFVGDELESQGLALTVTYNTGETERVVDGYFCTPYLFTDAGIQEVTVSYMNKTTTFKVSITPVVLTSISVLSAPIKTSYYLGETLDTAGLTLIGTYNNGTTVTITEGFTIGQEVLDKMGIQTVNVTYEGKTATFLVNVSLNVKVGNTVSFGPYEWKVLSKNGNEVLLITKQVIACKRFDESDSGKQVTWENCTLRQWLNSAFLANFSDEERAMINTTTVLNRGTLGRPDGNPTQDKVFLLSIFEVRNKSYFSTISAGICYPDETAKSQGIQTSSSGSCYWWTRSMSDTSAAVVNYKGNPGEDSELLSRPVDNQYTGVRPALWLKISDVDSIEMASNPTKLTYQMGEVLDTSGLSVRVYYKDGTSSIVNTGFSLNPILLTSAGSQKITVTYLSKTVTFNVTVTEETLSSIAIASNPTKTTYTVGETLDAAGLALAATYNSGMSETITSGFTCSPTTLSTAGTTAITVTYNGKTAVFNVTVNSPQSTTPGVDVGDIITFGPYEWIVLDKKGNDVMLITKEAIASMPYNPTFVNVTWKTCPLRSWLNSSFLSNFSAADQAKILTTTVSNPNNPDYGTAGGNTTYDKVFLLSIDEARCYFSSNASRQCVPDKTAIAQGIYTDSSRYVTSEGKATCAWWLRSPGQRRDYAALVEFNGDVFSHGDRVTAGSQGLTGQPLRYGVRPVVWVSFES